MFKFVAAWPLKHSIIVVTDELNDTKSDSERIKNQTPERPSDHGLLQSPQKDFKFPLIDLDLNSLDSYT